MPSPCSAGTYNNREAQSACSTCPESFFCGPAGVVDYSLGTFYAVNGIHACADPEGGALAWMKPVLGTPMVDIVGGLAKDKAGYVYISITKQDIVNATLSAAFLSKLGVDGTPIWTSALANMPTAPYTVHSIKVDGFGGIYMGVCVPTGQAIMLKFNDCGTEAWRQSLGPCSANTRVSLSAADDFVLVTWKASNGTSWLQRFAMNGTLQLNRNLGLNANDEPTDVGVHVSSAGWQGGYVVGRATATLNGQATKGGVSDMFLVRFNTTGAAVWTQVLGTSKEDEARRVAVDSVGNVFVVGTIGKGTNAPSTVTFLGDTTAGGSDAVLLKYWLNGSLSWYRMLSTPSDDAAQAIDLDERGNVYAAGYTNGSLDSQSFSGYNDLFLTKYSPGGARHWTRLAKIQALQTGVALTVAGSGAHVAGSTYSSVAGQNPVALADVFVAKYQTVASCVGLSEGMDYICPGKSCNIECLF
jgi:hypothetical protein